MNQPHEAPVTLTDADLEGVVGGVGMELQQMQGVTAEDLYTAVAADRARIDALTAPWIQEANKGLQNIGQLNEALGAASAISATFGANAGPGTVFGAGLSDTQRSVLLSALTKEYADVGTTLAADALKDGQLTKGELDTLISSTKGMLDSENRAHQFVMLRLEGLTSRSNEYIDLMANSLKKVQESQSSILGPRR